MATAGVPLWSTTAASNSTADPAVNFAEGMAPSAVNDSGRALMASVAKWRDDLYGLTTAGTSTAFTVTTGSTFATAAAMSGAVLTIIPHADSGAAPTLAVDGLTARAINYSTGVAVPTGHLKTGTPYHVKYVHASTEFIVLNSPAVLPASFVTTAAIADNAVTLAKIATIADQQLLGNVSGGSAIPSVITIGAGLTVSGTTLLSAFPPAAAFKNLSIKVASNTTVTVAADYVTTTNGTTFQTTAVSSTINLGTTGVDALDTGTIASGTWYAIWVIAKSDGTTKCVASTSGSSPTMPTDYTFKARIGWVTTAGSATLHGTWQLGRRVRYVVGLAQTTAVRVMKSTAAGSMATPTWVAQSVSSYVPTTASMIDVALSAVGNNATLAMVAPNNSYGSYSSSTNPPPLVLLGSAAGSTGGGTISGSMMLESTNIYYASDVSASLVGCLGWEDNI